MDPRCLIDQPKGSGAASYAAAFKALYQSINLEAPEILVLPNPLEYQWALNYLKNAALPFAWNKALQTKVDNHRPDGKAPKSVNLALWSKVGSLAARALLSAFGNEADLQAHHKKLRSDFQILEDAVQSAWHAALGPQKLKVELSDHHPNWHDYKWLSYYKEQLQHFDLAQSLWTILEAGLMYASCFESLVVLCPRPLSLEVEAGQLHNEEGPALHWQGLDLYYWRGIPVPEKLIENPDKISRADIDRYQNAEVRRCFQEALGGERFASLFDLEMIDSDFDLQGNKQFLYRSRAIDPVAKEYLQFAKVTCPTTQRNYFLCVPPDIKDVWQAVAWTFSKKKEDYRPSKEV